MMASLADLPGCGEKSVAALRAAGILTVADLIKSNTRPPSIAAGKWTNLKVAAAAAATPAASPAAATTGTTTFLKNHSWFGHPTLERVGRQWVPAQITTLCVDEGKPYMMRMTVRFFAGGHVYNRLVSPLVLLLRDAKCNMGYPMDLADSDDEAPADLRTAPGVLPPLSVADADWDLLSPDQQECVQIALEELARETEHE